MISGALLAELVRMFVREGRFLCSGDAMRKSIRRFVSDAVCVLRLARSGVSLF